MNVAIAALALIATFCAVIAADAHTSLERMRRDSKRRERGLCERIDLLLDENRRLREMVVEAQQPVLAWPVDAKNAWTRVYPN